MMTRTQAGQSPVEVARAAARLARKWGGRTETALICRAELGPYAPRLGAPDLAGRWVPEALHRWGRGLTFWREPSGPGTAGELVLGLPWVLAHGGGDCDDLAAAQGALAAACGLEAAVGLVWPVRGDASRAHVVLAVTEGWNGGPRWVVVDPQQPTTSDARAWQSLGVRWFRV